MAVPDRVDHTFGSVPDRQIVVAESGEADHADSNRCLVCQYTAMDVERAELNSANTQSQHELNF
jgi:hypothetical protein